MTPSDVRLYNVKTLKKEQREIKMTAPAFELKYKVKRVSDLQKGYVGNSYIVDDAENKAIIDKFVKEVKDSEELNGRNNYWFEYCDVEKIAILNYWYENEVELTELKGEASGYQKNMYSDGKNKLELNYKDVYKSCSIEHNFNFISFYNEKGERYFGCNIEDYKQGDEKLGLQKFLAKKEAERQEKLAEKQANKLTDEQKKEKTLLAQQKSQFLKLKKLTGTSKQIDWAVTIRAEVLEHISSHAAEKLLKIKYVNSAKFWIENRFKKSSDFEEFAMNFEKKASDVLFHKRWNIKVKVSREDKIKSLTEMSLKND